MKTRLLSPAFLWCSILFFLIPPLAPAQNWALVDGIPAGQTSALFAQGNTLYAAGPNKLYFTQDGGVSWDSTAVIDPEVDFIEAVVLIQSRLYVGTVVDGVYRSDDGGQTWQADNGGMAGLGTQAIKRFASRGDSLYVSTGGAGVFVKKVSTNSAWSAFNQNLPWHNVESITNIGGKLYAGAGGNATLSVQAFPSAAWTELPFDQFNGSVNFFLGAIQQGDVLLGAGTAGLYRSTDNGDTWAYHDPGTGILGSASFVSMGGRTIVNLAKPVGFSFIQYTDDEGLSWKTFEPEITGSYGFNLALLNGQLYSSRTDGLWRIELTTQAGEPLREASLSQNFPNPFSGSTAIPVTLAQATWLELSLFDAKGSLVRRIWQGEKPAGSHVFQVETAALPQGLYHCRLVTGSGGWSQSMLKVD